MLETILTLAAVVTAFLTGMSVQWLRGKGRKTSTSITSRDPRNRFIMRPGEIAQVERWASEGRFIHPQTVLDMIDTIDHYRQLAEIDRRLG